MADLPAPPKLVPPPRRQRSKPQRQSTPLWTFRDTAQKELAYSDYIATRCLKAGKPYPQEWRERDDVLRAMANGDRAVIAQVGYKIPVRPERPLGL